MSGPDMIALANFRHARRRALQAAAQRITAVENAPLADMPNFEAMAKEFEADMRKAVQAFCESDGVKALLRLSDTLRTAMEAAE